MTDAVAKRFDTGMPLAFFLIFLALAYFGFKTYQMSGAPGYDFRYIWLAGQMWSAGANPYDSAAYQEAASAVFLDSHQPEKWVYPTSWWAISVPLSYFSPKAANVVWNMVSVAVIALSCSIIARSYLAAFPQAAQRVQSVFGATPAALVLFSVLFFLMAIFESTAIHLSVGQTTVVALLGAALLLKGLPSENLVVTGIGVLLLALKPQIGLCFIVPLLISGTLGFRAVGLAVVLALLVSLPAFMISPTSIIEFAANVAAYDGFTDANLAQSMTGLRLAVFEILNIDIGNKSAVLATLVAILVLTVGPFRLDTAQDPGVRAWQSILLVTSLTLALAPLHTYDFILVAIPALIILGQGSAIGIMSALALLLMLRAENLADITGFHRVGVEIFPGSRIITIGAAILAIASLLAVARMAGESRNMER